jgi:peptide/nickel transport system substrate-binding protein
VKTDPAVISSDPEVFVANAVYDYLVDVTPGNTIVPRLATDWTTSADGLTYVFTLASGVTFHDGSAFSANDVVWTFNRLRDPNSGFPTVDLYKNIADIKATGDLQVTFTLSAPNPFFLYDLSDNHALIMKADTKDPNDFNGTGPFVVSKYSPEDRIILTANPTYFVAGEPKLAELDVIFFNDQSAMVDALKGGDVDLVMALSTDLFSGLKGAAGITQLQAATNQFDVVRLRSDKGPGKDPKVMQALKLGLDRQAVYDLVMGGFGVLGSDTPIGPMYTNFYQNVTLPAKDVAKAKQLLADAGYASGLSMDLYTPDTGDRPKLAAVLENQWADIGVKINVIVEPESVYYGDNGWMAVDLGITGWGSRPYPQFYLDMMLKCNAAWNESHFCDSEFDTLTTTAGTSLDESKRVDAYHSIQTLLQDHGSLIIPYFYTQLAGINSKFQGFELKAFSGRSDVRTVSLNQ